MRRAASPWLEAMFDCCFYYFLERAVHSAVSRFGVQVDLALVIAVLLPHAMRWFFRLFVIALVCSLALASSSLLSTIIALRDKGSAAEPVTALLRTRASRLRALVASARDADLAAAFRLSSEFGPTLRAWVFDIGANASLLEQRKSICGGQLGYRPDSSVLFVQVSTLPEQYTRLSASALGPGPRTPLVVAQKCTGRTASCG